MSPQHPELTEWDRQVYARQLPIPGLGEQGQRQLKGASVLISRVGGLGGMAAQLLVRAGVGQLVLAHDGVVEPENLNRMPLAFREDLDQPRIEVFCQTLRRINPNIHLVVDADNINSDNVARLMSQADLTIDGAPLFAERYLMNQEAVRQRKPLVMAAQYGLEGYASTFIPGVSACLTCIYPEPRSDWNLRCFPVIAPSACLVATIAAMEVIKLITGCGETLVNQLLYCDLTSNIFQRMRISRRADCAVCGGLGG